jgi:hypothetical protein
MTSAMRKANIRAAIWATAISGIGLLAGLLSRHFLFGNGGFHGLDPRGMAFLRINWILLMPGHVLALILRVLIQVLGHPVATWHIVRAFSSGESDFFIAEYNFGPSGFFPALITWVLYFLIVRAYYKGKARREEREGAVAHL